MNYDFTTIIDRHGLDSIAVDPSPDSPYRRDISLQPGIPDHIPMWVADMNFATVPTVPQKMTQRLLHPTYGYFELREEYFAAISAWQKDQFGIQDVP